MYPTIHRDSVRSTFSPDERAKYEEKMRAMSARHDAELAVDAAMAALAAAKSAEESACWAFARTPRGPAFFRAVQADVALGPISAVSA